MTVSEHAVTAYVVGTPNVGLLVKDWSLSLNAGRAPHVFGSIDIAFPDESTLDLLDPRDTPRIVVTGEATYLPAGAIVTRTFNLTLRDRDVQQGDATVRLTLASDEALLSDYSPLTDDDSAQALQGSLRSIVNYVLNKAIPGAALQATPAVDADMTRYWSLENLITDPRVSTIVGFTSAGGTGNLTRVSGLGAMPGSANSAAARFEKTGASATTLSINRVEKGTAGRMYTAVIGARKGTAGALTAEARFQFLNEAGAVIRSDFGAAVVLGSGGQSHYVSVTALAPPGTVEVLVGVLFRGTVAAGEVVYARNWMLTEGPYVVPFFDGGSTLAGYAVAWQGDADNATSTRTALEEAPPEALVWQSGQSALEFLAPLVQVAGFRLVCNESRQWTLRDENYVAPGSLTISYGVNLIDGADMISRESGLWFDAQVTKYTWIDANAQSRTAIDAYALTIPYTRLNKVEINAPYPGKGRSQYAVRRAQQRGREVSVTTVTDWDARAEEPIAVVLNGAPIQLGITQAVTFSADDRMTVETRTTDTPLGAIDLLSGTINALAGTINAL